MPQELQARRIRIRGTVQGVGFRPFVYRLAHQHGLSGWVLNDAAGVEIWLEGAPEALGRFLDDLEPKAPPAALIDHLEVRPEAPRRLPSFTIRKSERDDRPSTRMAPDLAVCDACLADMNDPRDRRYRYPYISCTNCGPRYSIITALPYDRPATTMKAWPLCDACRAEYDDPLDRRFHAQPVACPVCGPGYALEAADARIEGHDGILEAARRLRAGAIVAVKGIGGYHLACDATHAAAVDALRERKFRKEKAFAVMAATLEVARGIVELSGEAERILLAVARPIVLAPKRRRLAGVAPGSSEFGVMLPSTPLHQLLFAAGAPELLVMTSANRSSEPIAYQDDDARERLAGIADALLVGERPIARRVDDSVVRTGPLGVTMIRRARGYAPGAVATLPTKQTILAVGADLKNTVALVVEGQVFVSQHLGDLAHHDAFRVFEQTIHDLTRMYRVELADALVVHDRHPSYRSTQHALDLPARRHVAVQHHRAHIASVLAERGDAGTRVLGIAFDGTGYGDDGATWGGEFFVGSLREGLERVGRVRYARLPGGDAAASHPVQAAAGFLAELEVPDLSAPPFDFPDRYRKARQLIDTNVRVFRTSSVGRLFDSAAALLGFTREMSFEGQAAMWLEHLAAGATGGEAYPLPYRAGELDYRPLLAAVIDDRLGGRDRSEIARAFHAGLARGIVLAAGEIRTTRPFDSVVVSGGVFQNSVLLSMVQQGLSDADLALWLPHAVPVNDGGICLGQAALVA